MLKTGICVKQLIKNMWLLLSCGPEVRVLNTSFFSSVMLTLFVTFLTKTNLMTRSRCQRLRNMEVSFQSLSTPAQFTAFYFKFYCLFYIQICRWAKSGNFREHIVTMNNWIGWKPSLIFTWMPIRKNWNFFLAVLYIIMMPSGVKLGS